MSHSRAMNISIVVIVDDSVVDDDNFLDDIATQIEMGLEAIDEKLCTQYPAKYVGMESDFG